MFGPVCPPSLAAGMGGGMGAMGAGKAGKRLLLQFACTALLPGGALGYHGHPAPLSMSMLWLMSMLRQT